MDPQEKVPRVFGRKAWEAVRMWNQVESCRVVSRGHLINTVLVLGFY